MAKGASQRGSSCIGKCWKTPQWTGTDDSSNSRHCGSAHIEHIIKFYGLTDSAAYKDGSLRDVHHHSFSCGAFLFALDSLSLVKIPLGV